MSVTVRIPTPLRPQAAGQPKVDVEGATVEEVIDALVAAHPAIADRILDGSGTLRRFVNVFVGEDDIRFLDGVATPVPDGGTVSIVPAVAGG